MSETMESITPLDNIIGVKVGTKNMFRHVDGREVLDRVAMRRIGVEILELRELGFHVPIISSGAVTAGMEVTGTAQRPTGKEAMPETQRLAATGWHHVLNAWADALPNVTVGGILVTRRELSLNTPEHDEALRTTHTLLSHGEEPILDENDPITHGELSEESFGQNDTLSAIYIAQIANSELFGQNVSLVQLSDVDGVYEDANDQSTLIKEITLDDIDHYAHVAGGSNSQHGRGGMKTKFDAAKISLEAGVDMWVVNGRVPHAIQRGMNGEIGTHFVAKR